MSYGNASNAQSGNAGYGMGGQGDMPLSAHLQALRGDMRGNSFQSAPSHEEVCAFPAAPPRRVYCMPAAWTSIDGRRHHRLADAYGMARIAPGNR